jgi:SNF2 family DNA or RNA helicase
LRFDGSVSCEERSDIISKYCGDFDQRVLLITLTAGGVGLNLQVANHVMIVEPYWHASAEEQALKRIHRIGQTRESTVHFYVVAEIQQCNSNLQQDHQHHEDCKQQSIEQTICALQENKKKHIDAVFSNSLLKERLPSLRLRGCLNAYEDPQVRKMVSNVEPQSRKRNRHDEDSD